VVLNWLVSIKFFVWCQQYWSTLVKKSKICPKNCKDS